MDATQSESATPAAEAHPDEYAIVEVFGHRRHAGRIMEIERFGSKLIRIDIPTKDAAAAEGDPFAANLFESHFYGGGALFSVTPTTLEVVKRMNAPFRPALPYTRAAAERDGIVARDEDDEQRF